MTRHLASEVIGGLPGKYQKKSVGTVLADFFFEVVSFICG